MVFHFSKTTNSILTKEVSYSYNKIKYELPSHPIEFLRYTNHTRYVRELIPNFEQTFDGVIVKLKLTTIKINSNGFRDREFDIEKPKSIYRIIVLGDSVTFGVGVDLNETFTKIIENELNFNYSNNIDYEVLNFGVPGYNTYEEVNFFIDKGLKYLPDAVVIIWDCTDVEDSFEQEEIGKNISKELFSSNNNLTGNNITEISLKTRERERKIMIYILRKMLNFH